jgi:hypothetical protein
MKTTQPIQIIGTQRSGSNMLRLMLNQFDEITAPHPPHILQRFYPLLHFYGDLENNTNFYALVDDVCKLVECNPVPWTGVTFNRNEIVKRCKTRSLIEVFRVIYDLKAESENTDYWVCKSMVNVKFAAQLEESGMKMRYIYLYRDGRDVACSFKKAIVGEKHVYHIANQWAANQKACIELEKNIEESRFLKVSYENLLHHPKREMKRICSFLNIELKKEVFDFYHSEESKNTAIAGKMWENVTHPILKNNSNKYKTELTPLEIAIFEKQAGSVLQQLGYTLDNFGVLNGTPFSENELKEFNAENSRLKEIANQSADPEGMKLREKQDNLLKEIEAKHEQEIAC